MWKFERLERRDAPAGVIKVPAFPSMPEEDTPSVEPPYGQWYNDLIVGFDGGAEAGSTGSSGSSSGSHVPGNSSGAVDQVFAAYSERDLNTDGKVDLTDFIYLKATLNGGTIGVT